MNVIVTGSRSELLGSADVPATADHYFILVARGGVACGMKVDGKPFDLEPVPVAAGDTIKIAAP